MGSFISSLGGGAEDGSASSLDVLTFHSSARWQLHFNSTKEFPKLMVIGFSASCMEPEVHAMANKFTQVEFIKIDVTELPDVAQEYGVEAMPTFVLLKKGKEVDRVVGDKNGKLERTIEIHWAPHAAAAA